MARKKAPRYRVRYRHSNIYAYDRFGAVLWERFVQTFKTDLAAMEWCNLANLKEEGIDVNATVAPVPHKPRSRKKRLPVSADAPQCGASAPSNRTTVPARVDGGQARQRQLGGDAVREYRIVRYDPNWPYRE